MQKTQNKQFWVVEFDGEDTIIIELNKYYSTPQRVAEDVSNTKVVAQYEPPNKNN